MTRSAISSDEWLRQHQWTAMKMLAEHELLGETYWNEGRSAAWIIGKPGTNIHRIEIIAGIMGSLVVHGDFELSRFAHYGDRADAWSRLLWMAYSMDVGYYVAQKATIGMRREEVEAYEPVVAEYDLEYWIADAKLAGNVGLASVLREALDHVAEEHELREFLYDNDRGYDLWELRLGKVLRPHVIISHVALNKCASLLWEKYGAEGPRQCRPRPPGGPESPQKGCSLTP